MAKKKVLDPLKPCRCPLQSSLSMLVNCPVVVAPIAPSLPCPSFFFFFSFFLSCSFSVKLKHQGSPMARRHWLARQTPRSPPPPPPVLPATQGYNRQWTGPVSGRAGPGEALAAHQRQGQPAASLESLLRNVRFASPIGRMAPCVECDPCRGREATPPTTYTAEPWGGSTTSSQSGVSAQSVDERTAGGGGSGRLLEQVKPMLVKCSRRGSLPKR